MAVTFESVINWLVPLGIILLVGAVMYKAMKPMFDSLGELFSKMFGWVKDKGSGAKDKIDYDKVIVYR